MHCLPFLFSYKSKNNSIKVYIPEEILVEILKRVRAKSLLRFKSVAKSWYALISSSDFVITHLKHAHDSGAYNLLHMSDAFMRSATYSLHYDNDALDRIALLKFPSSYVNRRLDFASSANGLVCLSSRSSQEFCTILWNPSIGKFFVLPELKEPTSYNDLGCMYFLLGFGFDYVNNDYKVVRIGRSLGGPPTYNNEFLVYIFTLSTRSWRTVSAPFPNCLCSLFGHAYANGNFHWFSIDPNHRLVVFDMVTEVFRGMLLPIVNVPPYYMQLAAWGESISLLVPNGHTKVDMWVMNEYSVPESWTRQCSVDTTGRFRNILGFRSDGNMLIRLGDNFRLVSYCTKTSEIVYSRVKSKSFYKMLPFVDSLVLNKEGVSFKRLRVNHLRQ